MTILKITLGEEGSLDLSNQIKDMITGLKGKVLNSDSWGKRRFAYEIKHDSEGFYEVIEFEMEKASLAEFKQKLNLTEGMVRYLITKKEQN